MRLLIINMNVVIVFFSFTPYISPTYKEHEHIDFLLWSLTTIIGLALQFGDENGRTEKTDVIEILLKKDEMPNAVIILL